MEGRFPLHEAILLEVATYLGVKDALSLVQVCQATWSAGKNRSLWLTLLKQVRQTQPLSCPMGTNLRKLDLADLKRVALHTAKLERRLALPHLQKLRCNPPISIQLGQEAELFSLVSGGPYVFVHVPPSIVASIHVGAIVDCISQPYEAQGVFKIAMLSKSRLGSTTQRNPFVLRILSLTYGTNSSPQVCQTFQHTLEPTFQYYDTLLCKDYVAVVRKSANSTNVTFVIINMSTGRIASIETNLPLIQYSTIGYVFDGNLYYVIEQNGFCHVHIFRGDDLCPRDHDSNLTNVGCVTKGPFYFDWSTEPVELPTEPIAVIPGMPTYGTNVVSIQHVSIDGRHWTTVRFWPTTTTKSEFLKFGYAMGLTASLPGTIKTAGEGYLVFVGYSRALVLVVLQLHTNDLALQLVEFRHNTHSTVVHNLEIPQNLELDTVTNIALDDRRGEALLIDSSGVLFRLSYI